MSFMSVNTTLLLGKKEMALLEWGGLDQMTSRGPLQPQLVHDP